MNKIRERNLVFLNLQVHIYEVGVHMRTSIIYFYDVTNLWQSCGRERGRDKRIFSLISAPSPIFKSLSLSASVTHSTYQMTSTSPTLASPPSQITSPPSQITSPPSQITSPPSQMSPPPFATTPASSSNLVCWLSTLSYPPTTLSHASEKFEFDWMKKITDHARDENTRLQDNAERILCHYFVFLE